MNHQERYNLAMKLLKEDKSDKEVIDAFRNEPDFNERVTTYQIAFLRKRAEYEKKREECKHIHFNYIKHCFDCGDYLEEDKK